MSLRKSTCLTPGRLDAARRNSQQSTGPRSEAGKQRMKLNALKHGCDAAPENDADVMRALGEDPERFAALKQELATAYGPGDALWDRQIDDLARLYWRRNRIERMETGLMRDALVGVEERERGLTRALAEVTFEPSQCEAVAFNLPKPTHPSVRLRMLISLWRVIRDEVRRRVFTLAQRNQIESYYQGELGWRPRQIGYLLGRFGDLAYLREKQDPAVLDAYGRENFGDEAGVEARYQELERLLQEQIAAVEAAFAQAMQAQEEKDAIARDACLAPEDKTAEMVLRLGMTLDRAIDHKVRILLTLRKEQARECGGGSRTAPTEPDDGPPANESNDREAQELSKAVGLDDAAQEVGVARSPESWDSPALPQDRRGHDRSGKTTESQHQGLCATAARAESQKEENAPKTTKSPEQSQNVIENKPPAAREARGGGVASPAPAPVRPDASGQADRHRDGCQVPERPRTPRRCVSIPGV